MRFEEITLSVPHSPAEWRHGNDEGTPNPGTRSEETSGISKLAETYLKAVRARDRFAFTDKGRMRNREQFDQSLKAVVSNVAADASCTVKDRGARKEIRTQIYAGVMQLAKAMSKDHFDMMTRARTRVRWSLAVGAVGLLGIISTLVINGIVTWPPY